MKKLNCISMMALIILLIAACGPQATETRSFRVRIRTRPRPGDEDMQRDQVIIKLILNRVWQSPCRRR